MNLHNNFLNKLQKDYTQPELNQIDIKPHDEKTTIVTRWNWDYQDALEFQYRAIEFVREHRDFKVFIFCNHPHCFTIGSGLQKGRDHKLQELKEFDINNQNQLAFPIHKIKRGGGITFHYPGQWVVYPIINLNSQMFSLSSLTHWLLDSTQEILSREFDLTNLSSDGPFLGLWCGEQKLMSLGIGAKHFVTHHGVALNVEEDQKMFNEILKISPCGLNPQLYTSLNQLTKIDSSKIYQQLRDHLCAKLPFAPTSLFKLKRDGL